jgi:intracellular sulfur oxidation DsrE/DsrF family protein
MNVIFHVDDSSRWELTLGNVGNMLAHGQATGLAFAIEILANGPAVRDLAQGGPLAEAIRSLPATVRVCACRNALRKFSLPEDGLLPGVAVVPTGVVELALRQADGYAYIKP